MLFRYSPAFVSEFLRGCASGALPAALVLSALAALAVQAQPPPHTHSFGVPPQLSAPQIMVAPAGGGGQIYTNSVVTLNVMGPMADFDACTAPGCTLPNGYSGQPSASSPIFKKAWTA